MRQDVANKNFSRPVIDLGDQPVRISSDVKHREFSHGIRGRQLPPRFHQILPSGLLRHPGPSDQSFMTLYV